MKPFFGPFSWTSKTMFKHVLQNQAPTGVLRRPTIILSEEKQGFANFNTQKEKQCGHTSFDNICILRKNSVFV